MANVDMQTFDKIIVLDFGSQYNQLITRRIREFGVYSELLSHKLTAAQIKEMNPKGIIFSGGPNSVYDDGAFQIDPEIFELGIPILGICYGMQLMAHNLPGGKVESADNKEYGKAIITVKDQENVMFKELPETQTVWMSHGDLVTQVPEGFEVTATSDNCPISAMANNASMGYNSIQKYVTQNMVTIFYVILLSTFVKLVATGLWTTLSTCKFKRFAKLLAIRKSYLDYLVG